MTNNNNNNKIKHTCHEADNEADTPDGITITIAKATTITHRITITIR